MGSWARCLTWKFESLPRCLNLKFERLSRDLTLEIPSRESMRTTKLTYCTKGNQ